MNEKILVVDDEKEIADLLEVYLKNDNYIVHKYYNGIEALECIQKTEIDLAILDVMLPDIDGFRICQKIRENYYFPVIMLTAKIDDGDKIMGLTIGADDYITKPFSMLILGKRITALLRRSQNKPAVNTVKLGDITVDFSGYTASDENGKIDITPKELEILKVLIDNKGLVLSRNQILDEVWGYDCDVIDRTIDAYIRNIRKKLRLDCITTVKGIGYKFEIGQEI